MDIFNLELQEEDNNEKPKFEKLEGWFDFVNEQFEKIEESNEGRKIDSLLFDNDIKTEEL